MPQFTAPYPLTAPLSLPLKVKEEHASNSQFNNCPMHPYLSLSNSKRNIPSIHSSTTAHLSCPLFPPTHQTSSLKPRAFPQLRDHNHLPQLLHQHSEKHPNTTSLAHSYPQLYFQSHYTRPLCRHLDYYPAKTVRSTSAVPASPGYRPPRVAVPDPLQRKLRYAAHRPGHEPNIPLPGTHPALARARAKGTNGAKPQMAMGYVVVVGAIQEGKLRIVFGFGFQRLGSLGVGKFYGSLIYEQTSMVLVLTVDPGRRQASTTSPKSALRCRLHPSHRVNNGYIPCAPLRSTPGRVPIVSVAIRSHALPCPWQHGPPCCPHHSRRIYDIPIRPV